MPSAHAATSDSGTDWVALAISYWWVILILGGGILEWLGETFNCGLSALYEWSELRHERKVELAQARGAVPVAASLEPKPGPCVHRRVKQVRDRDDELVAWLCVGCDAELPADWAVAKEDL